MAPELGSEGTATTLSPYRITDKEFETIRRLVKEKTGISLGLHKKDLVVSRLARRLRDLRLGSFREYIALLEGAGGAEEMVHMINRITTNKTDFFREKHHFDLLAETLLPELYQQGEASGQRRLRAWSAGCSSGEEPYTIAMVVADFFARRPGWDIKILATDLDTSMLQKASRGLYEARLMEPVPPRMLSRYFRRVQQNGEEFYQVKEELRRMITFRKFNLMRPEYPLKVALDFVFCRNVLIYFDSEDKVAVVTRFHRVIKPGGYLFVGHSESLMMVKHLFRHAGPTIYRRQ